MMAKLSMLVMIPPVVRPGIEPLHHDGLKSEYPLEDPSRNSKSRVSALRAAKCQGPYLRAARRASERIPNKACGPLRTTFSSKLSGTMAMARAWAGRRGRRRGCGVGTGAPGVNRGPTSGQPAVEIRLENGQTDSEVRLRRVDGGRPGEELERATPKAIFFPRSNSGQKWPRERSSDAAVHRHGAPPLPPPPHRPRAGAPCRPSGPACTGARRIAPRQAGPPGLTRSASGPLPPRSRYSRTVTRSGPHPDSDNTTDPSWRHRRHATRNLPKPIVDCQSCTLWQVAVHVPAQ